MEVDPQDPVSSKGLLDANLASVIALKKGFEGKTPLGSPLSRLGAAPRSVLVGLCQPNAAASPSQPVPADHAMPWQGLPPWKSSGSRAGKGKNKSLRVCACMPSLVLPIAAGPCKAVVAVARQCWESREEERCFGVVGGDAEPP